MNRQKNCTEIKHLELITEQQQQHYTYIEYSAIYMNIYYIRVYIRSYHAPIPGKKYYR